MYGTVARYRLKPGMEAKLLEFEREAREEQMPGFVAEFTFRMDADPSVCFEALIFVCKEAYFAVADSPRQQALHKYGRILSDENP
jgi:hypothetical protein